MAVTFSRTHQPRDEQISFAVTKEEKQKILEKAREADLPASIIIRKILMAEVSKKS